MYLFFDFPMAAFGFQDLFGICGQTRNKVNGLHFDFFTDLSLRNNPNDAFQAFPLFPFCVSALEFFFINRPTLSGFSTDRALY